MFSPAVVARFVPLAPVIVSVKLPVGVEPAVVTVNVDEPAPVIDAGLKLAAAPAGNPLAPGIVSVKLPVGVEPAVVTVNVDEPAPVIDAGLKLAAAPAGNPLALKV